MAIGRCTGLTWAGAHPRASGAAQAVTVERMTRPSAPTAEDHGGYDYDSIVVAWPRHERSIEVALVTARVHRAGRA